MAELIIAKFGNPSEQNIGNLRLAFGEDLLKALERIIMKRQEQSNYFILVFAQVEPGNVIRTKILIMTKKPPKMLGTMCFFVNNRRSQLWKLWSLPFDIPKPIETIGVPIDDVADDAKGLPVTDREIV